jgi:hypothetical protein
MSWIVDKIIEQAFSKRHPAFPSRHPSLPAAAGAVAGCGGADEEDSV